ncbi:hypothetical protein GCM10027176_20110 [Actinoallomurus bryophytorum]
MSSNDLTVNPPSAHVVVSVATALERLAIRVTRDLDVDAQEGVPPEDPYWASTIADVAAYARECLAVLDDPSVVAVLTAKVDR